MLNQELAQILSLMADYLDMDEAFFESRAYSKVARVLESMEQDVGVIYQKGGIKAIKQIQGVGQGIAYKIEEYIKTGRVSRLGQLKKKCPVDLENLSRVEGLGPRKIKILYKKLKIKNLKDLGKAAKAGKVALLDGFGSQSEQNILGAIKFVKASNERFPIGEILPLVREIIKELEDLPLGGQISLAGSLRRMKETIKDADILITSNKPEQVMEHFVKIKGVVKIWAQGKTKSSVRFKKGFDCDLRVVKKKSFGAALQYFTGSKDHNISTRKIAKKKGLKLNEYGVYKGDRQIAGKTEKQVYQAIGLPYIEPELRTNSGEIEAGLNNQLPKLIGYDDIKGDVHCHTNWSDGRESIKSLARAAKKFGYQYLAITDHAGFLKIAHALDEKQLIKQMSQIDKVNQKLSGIKLIKGAEVDIRPDGSLAIEDKVLAQLGLVIGAVHSMFKMNRKDMTQRLIKAMNNPNLNIVAHPTGRVFRKRQGYQLDWPIIFKAAKKTRTALEINAHTTRLDLKDIHIRQAIESGVKLVISADVHPISYLSMVEYGIAQARRGWAESKDILNTRPLKSFLKYFE
ncbi:MAG: DNA polymerase III [Parcubacteria group bacterium]|jgi:DNA polymerase (family 10)|nr:DNA polymerase III [Parcubacteria group bacterium]|tara:strand:- start:57 stop:1769 length:1713 start_codon:yes stop_codon:yes gene_type:complete